MSLKQKIRQHIETTVQYLQHYTNRIWYPPLIGFLAFIDYFIFIIPTDGILISSVMLKPKNWFILSICTALGSTLGALILFQLTESYGLSWILNVYPDLNKGTFWLWTEGFFQEYGLFLVFFIAATPLLQQPVVIFAGLAHTPLIHFLAVIAAGRLTKYLILAYIGYRSPSLLSKLWGVKNELDEIGVHIDSTIHTAPQSNDHNPNKD